MAVSTDGPLDKWLLLYPSPTPLYPGSTGDVGASAVSALPGVKREESRLSPRSLGICLCSRRWSCLRLSIELSVKEKQPKASDSFRSCIFKSHPGLSKKRSSDLSLLPHSEIPVKMNCVQWRIGIVEF